MARRTQSRLEALAEARKNGVKPKRVNRGPTFRFPDNKLPALMKRLDLKVSAVAAEAGVDPGLVSAVAKGANPRLSTAIRLAMVAGMSVEELFGEAVIVGEKPAPVAENATAVPDGVMFSGADEPNNEGQKL